MLISDSASIRSTPTILTSIFLNTAKFALYFLHIFQNLPEFQRLIFISLIPDQELFTVQHTCFQLASKAVAHLLWSLVGILELATTIQLDSFEIETGQLEAVMELVRVWLFAAQFWFRYWCWCYFCDLKSCLRFLGDEYKSFHRFYWTF